MPDQQRAGNSDTRLDEMKCRHGSIFCPDCDDADDDNEESNDG